jgi:hypothetical protein
MSIPDHYAVIQDNLLLGRCPYDEKELEDIKTGMGASAVLSLQHDECLRRLDIDYERHAQYGQRIGLTMRRYPLLDHDLDDQQGLSALHIGPQSGADGRAGLSHRD